MSMWKSLLNFADRCVLPSPNDAVCTAEVNAWEPRLESLTDAELRSRSHSLRFRARSGEPLRSFQGEAFALMRESCRRVLSMRHYDSQIRGGLVLARCRLAEIQTGEGKTLTASLPLYLHALSGRGALLATVNDYLAERDFQLLRRPFELLGVSAGVVLTDTPPAERRRAYRCDVTYGTGKEFGFDFLRDRMAQRAAEQADGASGGDATVVQREPHFILVDEADCVLIDDAVTPLIIGLGSTAEAQRRAEAFRWAETVAREFREGEDFVGEELDRRAVALTAEGCRRARRMPKPERMSTFGAAEIYEFVERAVCVRREFRRDEHYVVQDGEIVIIDEFTGRAAEGRRWQTGIHEALEAKEGLEVRVNEGHLARVSVQHFFLRYPHLAGMTGTIASSRREVRSIYKFQTVVVPTHRPVLRATWPTKIFGNESAKWAAVVAEVQEVVAQGRPVLIGTRSIEKSEALSVEMERAGIRHTVLHARHVAREAAIVAEAGQCGRVTVATNMAGRGTDIKLTPEARAAGGLHVIGTELHDSRRIDRQLIGRCGRQGDPGSCRQFLALDDELLRRAWSPRRSAKLKAYGAGRNEIAAHFLSWFLGAQRTIERRMMRQRQGMLRQEQERKKAYERVGFDYYLDSAD